jgi:transposase-like protein
MKDKTNSRHVSIRYSFGFKQKVVREIEEEGLSLSQARRRYGIKGSQTIQVWLEKFGKNHLLNKTVRIEMKEDKDRIKELEAEVKRLKLALADSVMAKDILQAVIQIADEHYGSDLKKNFGPKSSVTSKKKDTP